MLSPGPIIRLWRRTWSLRDRLHPVHLPQTLGLFIYFCLVSPSLTIFFLELALEALGFCFVCFFSFAPAALFRAGFGFGLGFEARGFGVEFPLGAGVG